ncbi:uncharacterized protein N7511_000644 [Penicillium nucicola]|uniref:uncharacterized protein n=1 Tax=Penicillium nucicola TaxID=1850975 RepID=UPI0025455CAE|nr:uncharacterized protein N7511_000644 [Penicillium nucicola]KAJ5775633.1 hypothetical protein N7511_000644 [Penicillium nucicola]
MSSPLRIAILECDEPIGETKRKFGSFSNLFHLLFAAGVVGLQQDSAREGPEIVESSYDVHIERNYPELDDIDAVVLTGSRYDSFSNGEENWILQLVDFVANLLHHQTRVKVIGVCFGHQIIGRALGVMPVRNRNGWEVAVTEIELTSTGRRLFGLPFLAIHQMHRDMLPVCPANVELLGWSERCPVQGMYQKGRLLSMQGHPEYHGSIADELLERRGPMVFGKEIYDEAKSRVDLPHNGVAIAARMLEFLLE